VTNWLPQVGVNIRPERGVEYARRSLAGLSIINKSVVLLCGDRYWDA